MSGNPFAVDDRELRIDRDYLALPHLWIHQVLRPLTQQRAAQVGIGTISHGLACLVRSGTDVWQGDRVAQLEQR